VAQSTVSPEAARRIAVRAQLLDGRASGVLDTVRRLGFLQIDVVQPVERPQHLVLYSRLGPSYDRAELDRLLWEERSLFEWNAFVYPVEELPVLRARIRRFRRERRTKDQRWVRDFLTENAAFRRYVLRELDRNGPMLSRDFEDRAKGEKRDHRWWGSRMVGLMLLSLHLYGEITVVGRQGQQLLWDRTERWWPETDALSAREADALRAERAFRTQGVRLERGEWVAHPDAADGPVPDRAVLLSPFDRLVYDRARAEAAHAVGAILVVDNTFATPYLQSPLDLGADVVVHSTTKYLGGHSDVVGGFAATNDPTIAERLFFLQKSLGAVPGPFDSWLVLRGLKTLAVRMQRHCENARAIASWLEGQPGVEQVLYPGLPAHPGHEIAARQMRDFGGMISFLAESEEAAVELVARTKLFQLAESLGGVESLIEHPARMTHASTASAPFAAPPNLIRLSVGIEAVDDLVADLEQALVPAATRAG
jgi:uncharacterized protein YcaQ